MPKLCQFENCRNRATYAEFYGIPIRCKTHKEKLYNQYKILLLKDFIKRFY